MSREVRLPEGMHFTTEEQFRKLPRYAQSEICKALAEERYYREKYHAISGEKSWVWIDSGLRLQDERYLYLPEEDTVTFKVEEDRTFVNDGGNIEVNLARSRDHVRVRARDGLIIAHESTNSCRIYNGRSVNVLR